MNIIIKVKEKIGILINTIDSVLSKAILDNNDGKRVQSLIVFASIALVSGYMTVTNYITKYKELMFLTLIFTVLMIVNFISVLLDKRSLSTCKILGAAEYVVLVNLLVVSGEPDGFPSIWVAIVPSIAFLMYKQKSAMLICLCSFLCLVFFFWTSYGQSFLLYDYSSTWELRFPLYFIACFFVSLTLSYAVDVQQREIITMRDSLKSIVDENSRHIEKMTYKYCLISTKNGMENICIDRLLYIIMKNHCIYYYLLGEREPYQSDFCKTSFKEAIKNILTMTEKIILCTDNIAINIDHIKDLYDDRVEFHNGEILEISNNVYSDIYCCLSNLYVEGK